MKMPNIINDGADVYTQGDTATFKTNISAYDRRMLRQMKKDRQKFYTYPVPYSMPEGKDITIKSKIEALKQRNNATIKDIKMQFKIRVKKLKEQYEMALRSGQSVETAKADYTKNLEAIKKEYADKLNFAKRAVKQMAQEIRMTIINSSKAMSEQIKNEKMREIQALEQKKREIQELATSGKMNAMQSQAQISEIDKKINVHMKDMYRSDLANQVRVIEAYAEVGQISPKTAQILIQRKKDEFKTKLGNIGGGVSPTGIGISFVPVDVQTGRTISPKDMENEIAFITARAKIGKVSGRPMYGANKRLRNLRKVLQNMNKPNATKQKKIKIFMHPTARLAKPEGGTGNYASVDSQRIDIKQSTAVAPERPTPAEAVPSAKVLTVAKSDILAKKRMAKLIQRANKLNGIWNARYAKVNKMGLNKGVQFVMKVSNLKGVKNEIREARRTLKGIDEINNKLKMFIVELKNQIQEMDVMIKSQGGK